MTPKFYINLGLLLVVSLFGIFTFKKNKSAYKILIILVSITFCSEFTLKMIDIENSTKIILYHFVVPITIIFNAFIYFNIWGKNNKDKKQLILVTSFFVIITICNSLFYQRDIFPSLGVTLLCLFAVWFSLITFRRMIDLPSKISIFKNSDFWFCMANLFFYSIGFFSFTFYNFYEDVHWINEVNWISNIVFYSTYFIAIYFDKNRNLNYAE